MEVGLKGLRAHRWGQGKKGEGIWDRKNSPMGKKVGATPSVLEERAGGWETAWISWIGQDWRAGADTLKGLVLNPKTEKPPTVRE